MARKIFVLTAVPVLLSLVFSGCGNKNVKKTAKPGPETVQEAPALPVEGSFSETDIRGTEFSESGSIQTIIFELDKYFLSDTARTILQKNAAYLKEHKDWEIIVEGNCDERGTIEYNIALGQKRAKEVRDYYVRLGLPGSMIGTISYGKERPVCYESSEDCWTKNRRAETKVRIKAVPPPAVTQTQPAIAPAPTPQKQQPALQPLK